MRAESAFERLWNTPIPKHLTEGMSHTARLRKRRQIRQRAKGRALKWLAEQLGIATAACNLETFDAKTCARVIELCYPMDSLKVRAWSKERG